MNVRFPALVVPVLLLAGCSTGSVLSPSETFTQGYVIDEETLALVPEGSSREQVLLALGSPSIERNFGQGEVFYYISQQRRRNVAFARANVIDQRILAVSFGEDERVASIANYGLRDGRVFDFISRTTPTGGREATFLGGVLSGLGKGGVPKIGG